MRRYIVHYNQHYKGTQFAGFDLINQTTNVGFTKITLDEFNTIEFNDEDLVILPLFTMHDCNESTTLFNGFIKKYINSKNYNREKTIVILGTPREPINQFNLTLNRQFGVEEASRTQVSFFKTFLHLLHLVLKLYYLMQQSMFSAFNITYFHLSSI
mgnify:CR=1 FL=1